LRDEASIRLHDLQLDYIRAAHPHRDELELIRGAVRLSAHVVENDPYQFASQLVGRLLPFRGSAIIDGFVGEISQGAPKPWLRPLRPALLPPGSSLERILEGHSDSVNGVAVTADGKRAVSASFDNTLKVWDLESGRALRTLEGHSDSVNGVAVTADGRRAVSASTDNTLKVWDLESGSPIATFHCDASLQCCAVAREREIIAGDASGQIHFLLLVEQTNNSNG
jgi:WD40 repeat protein